jgi:DNA-binding Xre family transcriptional regulator
MNRPSAATLLGRNVQRLCNTQGISLDVLAQNLGWSKQMLAHLKAGSLDITLDQVDPLCLALDVRPHDLFEEVTMASNQAQQLRYG